MMVEDFLNAFSNRLHVIRVIKIMDFKLFVFIAAKIAILDSKIMVQEHNVYLKIKLVLKATKMMEGKPNYVFFTTKHASKDLKMKELELGVF